MKPRKIVRRSTWAGALLGLGLAAALPQSDGLLLERVSPEMLCLTEGKVTKAAGDKLSVNVSKMRAYVNRHTAQAIEARFRYLGPTEEESKLGSGEVRRQFGLKLRSQDACNVVYVMWRIEPESKLVVSVKSNPGQHTSAECGNRGYQNIKPSHSLPVPRLQPEESHLLRGEMRGDEVRVFVDGSLIWQGNVGATGGALKGGVGVRSDNARLELELRAGVSGVNPAEAAVPCRADASDAE